MKNIKIIIATHKKYEMPKDDMYIPLHVGKAGKEDLSYIGDDTGENISLKNGDIHQVVPTLFKYMDIKIPLEMQDSGTLIDK